MDRSDILRLLVTEQPEEIQQLCQRADLIREQQVGSAVHLRGLVEVSSYCARNCHYCGLRAANRDIPRYRMQADEILDCARLAVTFGYGTLVMQSGEDDGIEVHWLAEIIRHIKATTSLAITLSLGERSEHDLRLWKEAGADRYLLRFETSSASLYQAIHPNRGNRISDRIAILRCLKKIGYEVGSGVMVGIPGQDYSILADDLLLIQDLDLDMIGIGPFIAHPDTPLGQQQETIPSLANQVPATVEMTCKAVALARILRPDANIPATTAVAVMDSGSGRSQALCCGANVIMPNLTPTCYREMYSIYPGKANLIEAAEASDTRIRAQITELGRTVGFGQGGRKKNQQIL